MGELFDVIVVGAGPAGSMAARECSRQGLETILIEKDRMPRQKTCAGAVSVKALNLIASRIPDCLVEAELKGLRFFSPSLDSVEVVSKDLIGISTTRDRFDAFLADLATQQGSHLVQSDGIVDISVSKEKAVCRLESGRLVEGCMIVGSDGAKGATARKTGIREKWAGEEVGLCLETRIPLDRAQMEAFDSEMLELYFVDVPFGYAWVLPKRSSISLGVGGCLAYLRKPREMLMDMCHTVEKLKNVNLRMPDFSAHLVPAGGFERKIVSDRVVLAGDAAGFVDPFSGEGIFYAMKSGLMAAEACKKAIDEQDTTASFLEKHYSRKCMKSFGEDLKIALDLTRRIHNRFDVFFDFLRNHPDPSWIHLAQDKITYRGIRKKLLPSLATTLINNRLRSISLKKRHKHEK